MNPELEPKKSVLQEAAAIVDGPRRESYGTPFDNHSRTAAMWSAYLGRRVTAHDVCMLNILQKASRDAHRPTRDNLVDIAGYARNAELVDEETMMRERARLADIALYDATRRAKPMENADVGFKPEVSE